MSSVASGAWDCPTCTFHNEAAGTVCEMCATPHVASSAGTPAAVVDGSEAEELSSWTAALAVMDDVSETALQQQFAYYEPVLEALTACMRFLDKPESREFLATALDEVLCIFLDQGAIPTQHAEMVNQSIELGCELCFRLIDEHEDVRCINAMVSLMNSKSSRYIQDKLAITAAVTEPRKPLFDKVTEVICERALPALGLLISGQIASQQADGSASQESSSWRGCGFAADILKGIRKLNEAVDNLSREGILSETPGLAVVSTQQLLATAERYVTIVSEMDVATLRKEDPSRITQLLEAVSELWGSRSAKGAELQLGIVYKLLNAPGLTQRLAAIDVLRDMAERLAKDPHAAGAAAGADAAAEESNPDSPREDTSFGLHSLAGWLSSHKVQFIAGLTGRNMHSKCLERARGLITVLAHHGEVDDPSLDQLWSVVSKAHDAADEARPIYDMVATIVEHAPVGQALSLLDRVWAGADEEFTKTSALVSRLMECKREQDEVNHLIQSSLISLAWRVLFHPSAPVEVSNAGPLHPRTRRRRSADETARLLKYLNKTEQRMLMSAVILSQSRLSLELPTDLDLRLCAPSQLLHASQCIHQEHDALSHLILACLAVIRQETARFSRSRSSSQRAVRDLSVRAMDVLAAGLRFVHFLCEQPREDMFQLSLLEKRLVCGAAAAVVDESADVPPATDSEEQECGASAALQIPPPPAPVTPPPEMEDGDRVSLLLAHVDALHGLKATLLQNLQAFSLHSSAPSVPALRVRCSLLYSIVRHAPTLLLTTDELVDLWCGGMNRTLQGRHAMHELLRRVCGGGLLDMVVLIQELYGALKENAQQAWQDCKHNMPGDGVAARPHNLVPGDLFQPIVSRDAYAENDESAAPTEDPATLLEWTGLHYETSLEHAGAFRTLASSLTSNLMDGRPARPHRYGSLESTGCLQDTKTYRPVTADNIPHRVYTSRDVLLLEGQMLQLFLFFFDASSSAFKPMLLTSEGMAAFQTMFLRLNASHYVVRCGKRVAVGGVPGTPAGDHDSTAVKRVAMRAEERLRRAGGGLLMHLQLEGNSPRLLASHTFPALMNPSAAVELKDLWADVSPPAAERLLGYESLAAIATQAPPPIARAAGDLLVQFSATLVRQATELVAYAFVDALEQLQASSEAPDSEGDYSDELWQRISGMAVHHPLVDMLLQLLRRAESKREAYTGLRAMQLLSQYMSEIEQRNDGYVDGSHIWTQHAVPEAVVEPTEASGELSRSAVSPGRSPVQSPGRSPGRRGFSRSGSGGDGDAVQGPLQFRWRPQSLQALVKGNTTPLEGRLTMQDAMRCSLQVMRVLTQSVTLPSHLSQVSGGKNEAGGAPSSLQDSLGAAHSLGGEKQESAEESAFLCAVHTMKAALTWDENGAETVQLPALSEWRTLWQQGARQVLQVILVTSAQGQPPEHSTSCAALKLRIRWDAYTPDPLKVRSTWIPSMYIASAGYSTIFRALRSFSVVSHQDTAPVISSPHSTAPSPLLLAREASAQSTATDDGKADRRARVASAAARDHAWQLLMQLPTSLQGSEALADPSIVDWPELLADGGWNTLYTLQGVVAKLKDANSRRAGDSTEEGSKALQWRQAFLAAGGLRAVLKRLVSFVQDVPDSFHVAAATPPAPPGSALALPPPLPPQRQASAVRSAIAEQKVKADVTSLCLRVLRICSKFVSSQDLQVLQASSSDAVHPAVVFGETLMKLLGDVTGQAPSSHKVAAARERGDTAESLGLDGDTPVLAGGALGGSTVGTAVTASSTAAVAPRGGGAAEDTASTQQADKQDTKMREAMDILLLLMSINSRFKEFGGSHSSGLLGALLSRAAPVATLCCVMTRCDLPRLRSSLQRNVLLSQEVLQCPAAIKQCIAGLLSTLAASDSLQADQYESSEALCSLVIATSVGPSSLPLPTAPQALHGLLSLVAFFKSAPTSGIRWPVVAALHCCAKLVQELSASAAELLQQPLQAEGTAELVRLVAEVEPQGASMLRSGAALLQTELQASTLAQGSTVATLLAFVLDVVLFAKSSQTSDAAHPASNWPLCVAAEERAAAYSLLRHVLLAGAKPAMMGAFDDPHLFPSRGPQAAAAAKWFQQALAAVTERTAGSGTVLESEWAHELSLDVRGSNSYMGLVNPKGATCYANSVVQQLFMDPTFQNTLLSAQEDSVPMLRSTLALTGKAAAAEPSEPEAAAADDETVAAEGGAAAAAAGAAVAAAPGDDSSSKRRQWLQHRRLLIELQKTFKWLRASEHKAYNPSKLLETFNCLKLSFDVHAQNDAPEFFVKLIDHLERVTAGTPAGDALKRRFVGRVAQQIMPFSPGAELRERPDKFTVLGVSVKRHSTLESALRTEFAPEMLYGANGVQLPSGERCDAEKRDVITRLPEVLVVQLRRFETHYTATGVDITKVNSRLAFPQVLDMKPYTKWGVAHDRASAELEAIVGEESPDAEAVAAAKRALRDAKSMAPPEGSEKYRLAGVVVHTGTARGGHYYSFSKDEATGEWWELNDTFTSTFSERSLAREAFGGHEYVRMGMFDVVARPLQRNAVMLFYHRCEDGPLSAPGDVAAATGQGEESAPHLDDVDVQDESLCPPSMAMVPTAEAHAALDAELVAMNQQAAEQIQRYDAQLMTFFGMLSKDLARLSSAAVAAGPAAGDNAHHDLAGGLPRISAPYGHSVLNVCAANAARVFLDIGMRCVSKNARTLFALLAQAPLDASSTAAQLLTPGVASVDDVRKVLKNFVFQWQNTADAGADDKEVSPIHRIKPASMLVSGLQDLCRVSAPAADLVVRHCLQPPAAAGRNSSTVLDGRITSGQDLPVDDASVERFLSPSVHINAQGAPVPFQLPWWAMQQCTPEGVPLLPKVDSWQAQAVQQYLARETSWIKDGLLQCVVDSARARFVRLLAAALHGCVNAPSPPPGARVAPVLHASCANKDLSALPSPFLVAAARQLPAGCWWASKLQFERDMARRQQLVRFLALEARLKVRQQERALEVVSAQKAAANARAVFAPYHARALELKETLHALEAPLDDSQLESDPSVVQLRQKLQSCKQAAAQSRAATLAAVQTEAAATSKLTALQDWLAAIKELQLTWRFAVRQPESPAALAMLQWFGTALSACDTKCNLDGQEFFSLVSLLLNKPSRPEGSPEATPASDKQASQPPAQLLQELLQAAAMHVAAAAGSTTPELPAPELGDKLRALYAQQHHAYKRYNGQAKWLEGPLFHPEQPNVFGQFLSVMNVAGSLAQLLPLVQDSVRAGTSSNRGNTLRGMLEATAALTPLVSWAHPSALRSFLPQGAGMHETHALHPLLRGLGAEGAFGAQVAARAIAQSTVWYTVTNTADMDDDVTLQYTAEALPRPPKSLGLAAEQLRAAVQRLHSASEGRFWGPILADIVSNLPNCLKRPALKVLLCPSSRGGGGLLEIKETPASVTSLLPASAHTAEAVCRFVYELCTPRVMLCEVDHANQSIFAELTRILMLGLCRKTEHAHIPAGCDPSDVDLTSVLSAQDSFLWDIAAQLMGQELLVSPWAQLPAPPQPVLSPAQWSPVPEAAASALAWDWGPIAAKALKLMPMSLIFKANDVHSDSLCAKLSSGLYVAGSGAGEFGQAAYYMRRTLYLRAQVLQELQYLRRLLIPRRLLRQTPSSGTSATQGDRAPPQLTEAAIHSCLLPSEVQACSMPSPLTVRESDDTLAVRISGAGCARVNGVYVNWGGMQHLGAPVFKRRFAGQVYTLMRFRSNTGQNPWYILRQKADGCCMPADVDYYVSITDTCVPPSSPDQWSPMAGTTRRPGKQACPSIKQICGPPMREDRPLPGASPAPSASTPAGALIAPGGALTGAGGVQAVTGLAGYPPIQESGEVLDDADADLDDLDMDSSTSVLDSMVEQVEAVTGKSEAEARDALRSNGWNVEAAIMQLISDEETE